MSRLERAFHRDVAGASLPDAPLEPAGPVSGADIAGLPATVRRYLAFMGVVGQRPDWSFAARFDGRFRRSVDGAWMPCTAWQYNTALGTARIFTMDVRFAKVVPMIGHDTYLHGRGRMLGKVLGLVTVADGSGEPFDIGELVTYLNDAILLAPSMLLDAATSWAEVDHHSFDVSLTDSGRTVSARVELDERGAPVDFSTTDRFIDADGGPRQCRWTTPGPHWDEVDGRPLPGPTGATWHLEDGPFTYIEGGFVPGTVRYNLPPPAR